MAESTTRALIQDDCLRGMGSAMLMAAGIDLTQKSSYVAADLSVDECIERSVRQTRRAYERACAALSIVAGALGLSDEPTESMEE